jgi:hypothetical protein
MNKIITIALMMFSLSALAEQSDYTIDFGLIMKNKQGEPIGFDQTNTIPIHKNKQDALYGLVVTKFNEEPFKLSAIHVFPENETGSKTKLMSKTMEVVNRGAIFFQTSKEDTPGKYAVEVYLDNILINTIDYQLVSNTDFTDSRMD